jgi:hypothetical protein
MKVREARELAERLGYRLEKVRGRDVWIVRDLYSDVAVRTGKSGFTFTETVRWLRREESRGQLNPRSGGDPSVR